MFGEYQARVDYYCSLLPSNDRYLCIFSAAIGIHGILQASGIHSFDEQTEVIQEWENVISTIVNTEGFSRCWGSAKELLELMADWRGYISDMRTAGKAPEKSPYEPQMHTLIKAVITGMLTILPGYVKWNPQAKLEENQAVLNHLQERGNVYRRIGNPKLYAYDRVVKTIAETEIIVTPDNCRYFHGIGPNIEQHIVSFFENPPPQKISLKELPTAVNVANKGLIGYLWAGGLQYHQAHQSGKGWAWQRAAASIAGCRDDVRDRIETVDRLRYVGEEMADVIAEYYTYYETRPPPSEITTPEQCPFYEDRDKYHNLLLRKLWEADYKKLVAEIALKGVTPFLQRDFRELEHGSLGVLKCLFQKDRMPKLVNWANVDLMTWLWRGGCKCTGPAGSSYYKAAKTVARKRKVVDASNLATVKYVGDHIAGRIRSANVV